MTGTITAFFGSLGDKADALKSKLILYIIVGIVVIVIISLLLEGVKQFIRGLDTAALGGLFLWLGYKANDIPLIKATSSLLLAAGGTLFVVGILVFVITRVFRRRRVARKVNRERQKQGVQRNEDSDIDGSKET